MPDTKIKTHVRSRRSHSIDGSDIPLHGINTPSSEAYKPKPLSRGISFYRSIPDTEKTTPLLQPSLQKLKRPRAASNIIKNTKHLDDTLIKKESLADWFENLFSTNAETEIPAKLITTLLQDQINFSRNIQILKTASDSKNNKVKIANILLGLPEETLLNIFAELFKAEEIDTWCRNNGLLATLIQNYLSQTEIQIFKAYLWNTTYSLAKDINKITINKRASIQGPPVPNTYDHTADMATILNNFPLVLLDLIAFKNFPILMQKILQLAYVDLQQRELNNTKCLSTLLGFITLRWIIPVIVKNTESLTDENANMWFGRIIPSVMQTICSGQIPKIACEEINSVESLKQKLYEHFPADYQNKLHLAISGCLEGTPRATNTSVINTLDAATCLQYLNDQLQIISGFRKNADGTFLSSRHTHQRINSSVYKPPVDKTALASTSNSDKPIPTP